MVVVQIPLVKNDQTDRNHVDQENNCERSGDFRAVVLAFIIGDGSGCALFATLSHGAEALEDAFPDRAAFDWKGVRFHADKNEC